MAVGVLALFYVGDYVSARFGIPGHRPTFGTVQVQTMYAVRQKNHRIDYSLGDVIPQTCVNSLFPQMGYAPCWYLSRHATKQINIGRSCPVRNRRVEGAAVGAAPPAGGLLNGDEYAGGGAADAIQRRGNQLVAARQSRGQGDVELIEAGRPLDQSAV